MRKLLLSASLVASLAVAGTPDLAGAYPYHHYYHHYHHRYRHYYRGCHYQRLRNGRIGAVSGAVGGGIIGGALTHGGVGGALLGAGLGAFTGHALARTATRC